MPSTEGASRTRKNVLPQLDDDLFEPNNTPEVPPHIATEFEDLKIVEKNSRYNKKYKAFMIDYSFY